MQRSSVKKAKSWMVAFLFAPWDSIVATRKVRTTQNGKFWPLYPPLYSNLRFGLTHPLPLYKRFLGTYFWNEMECKEIRE